MYSTRNYIQYLFFFLFLNFNFLAALCHMGDLGFLSRMELMPPAMEGWSPNHWTTREGPYIQYL